MIENISQNTLIATLLGRLFMLYLFKNIEEQSFNSFSSKDVVFLCRMLQLNLIKLNSERIVAELIALGESPSNNIYYNRLRLNERDLNTDSKTILQKYAINNFINIHFINECKKEFYNIQNSLKLKEYRASQNLTMKELAEKLNINYRNISAWENHKKNLHPNFLKKLL